MNRLAWILILMTASATLPAAEPPRPLLTGKMTSIEGKPIALESYKGKVLLLVNTASRCGYTRQYKGLQALHDRFSKQGLVVMGFPCNQFGKQEPAPEKEILAFCEARFGVKFPLFAKVDVKGPKAAPLFQALTSDKAPVKDKGPVKWNFEKFLIDRHGQYIGRYRSKVEPDAPTLLAAIEQALAVAPKQN